MDRRLVIDLDSLPEEGRRLQGEISPEVFELSDTDARPVGPLSYDLHVQRFEDELFLSASLAAPFEFTCVRTLHPFVRTIRLDGVAISMEIAGNRKIDASEALREEILLQFPANPRCDEADEPMQCAVDPRYLAVDKPAGDGVEDASAPPGDDRWAALDAWSKPAEDER